MNEEQTPLESLENLEAVETDLEPSPVEASEGEAALPVEVMEPPSDLPEVADAAPDSEQIIATLQGELANHRQELAQQSELLETYKTRYISLAAEFDNFRKRTQRERQEQEQQIKAKTLNELLTVVDNFERARTQIKPSTEEGMDVHKSYQGVYKSFVDGLKRLGVSPMRPEGQPFDPNYHEALLQEPTSEHPEGTVMEELVRGYLLEDRVLRHARVKVAAPPTDGVTSGGVPASPASEGQG
ncbi:MAG: nucleotide exchange factor GrpE [Cyanobacteriota bacterium]|jgi:molecular chaperone GrpE